MVGDKVRIVLGSNNTDIDGELVDGMVESMLGMEDRATDGSLLGRMVGDKLESALGFDV